MAEHKLHLYTGNGKGKTTAAMGLALRAHGHGLPVLITQFLKDGHSGEITALSHLPGVTMMLPRPTHGFVFQMTEAEKAKVKAIDDSLTNLYGIVQDMKERNPVYKTIADVPDWGKGMVQKLIDSGVMQGDEHGDINVSGDMLRGMVIMERMLEKK